MSQILFNLVKDVGSSKAAGQQVYKAIASTAALDRDREVLVPPGCQIDNFLKNPVMLFIHQQRQVPVGKVISIDVTQEEVSFQFVFAETDVAKEVKSLYDGGFMSAFSVGFYPKTYMYIEDQTPKQMELTLQSGAKYNLDLTKYPEQPRAVISDWELLEISPVPVPSNPEALLVRSMETAIRKSIETNPLGESLVRAKLNKSMQEVMSVVKSFIKDTEEFVLTGTVPSTDCKVDKDSEWDRMKAQASLAKRASSDGSGAKDTLDWAKYAEGFAWVNPEKAQELISYKLAHHYVDSEGAVVANFRAVCDAMAKLLGENHGGISSDDDLKEVYAHLAKHYADAEVAAPEFKLDYTADQLTKISKGEPTEEAAQEETPPDTGATEEDSKSVVIDAKNLLAPIIDSIKVLSETIAEGNEALSLRMGILLDTMEEVSIRVSKQNSEGDTSDEGSSEEDDKSTEDLAGEGVLLEEFKQATDLLKSFSVSK